VKIFLGNDGSAPVEKIGPYAYDLHDFCFSAVLIVDDGLVALKH